MYTTKLDHSFVVITTNLETSRLLKINLFLTNPFLRRLHRTRESDKKFVSNRTHQLMPGRHDPEDELLLPLRVESSLLCLRQHRVLNFFADLKTNRNEQLKSGKLTQFYRVIIQSNAKGCEFKSRSSSRENSVINNCSGTENVCTIKNKFSESP